MSMLHFFAFQFLVKNSVIYLKILFPTCVLVRIFNSFLHLSKHVELLKLDVSIFFQEISLIRHLNKGNITIFLTFPAVFYIPIFFSNLNYNCSNFLDVTNLQEQIKKAFCHQKLFWPFTVRTNSDLKIFANLGLQPQISKVFLDH